ncbi:DUF2255 family protein [Cellulomonas sp. PS-H5]|uniref:DUF2255 family protein n=1 Tax=Cellulomonas sp. PS-H5 TaxID=2820400 RepID=UPI001C4ECB6E|nr:DUF2255 family protein [Cellulomonas sp. PS-H5]MBW0253786.1 DUF2255 family protein [Cellulomonas sp. PS-H5]
MSGWTAVELERIGRAEELRLASSRPDGALRPAVTIWVVRVGDDLVVRSAYGPGSGWFRRAQASGRGRVEAGGVTRDVRFEAADPAARDAVDAAYHAKYDRFGPRIVGSVVGPQGVDVTLRLVPEGA